MYESAGIAILTVTLSHITTQVVKVKYTTIDGTAVSIKKEKDYKSDNASVTISPGALNSTLSIPIYNDGRIENTEYFYVNLTKPTNCILGDVTGMVTILDEGTLSSARLTTGAEIESLSEEETTSQFDVTAYPNPSYSDFMLEIISADDVPAEARVFNSAGQVIYNIRPINNSLRVGQEWNAGIYIVEVVQGRNRKTIKLIKY